MAPRHAEQTLNPTVADQVATGTDAILESPHVTEGPGRIANAPVPSVFVSATGKHAMRKQWFCEQRSVLTFCLISLLLFLFVTFACFLRTMIVVRLIVFELAGFALICCPARRRS